MALSLLSSAPVCNFTRLPHGRLAALRPPASASVPISAAAVAAPAPITISHDQDVVRRSGNYLPSIWNYEYLQSLSSVYEGESYTEQAEKLKEKVRVMLEKMSEPLDQLMLIDDLQRLGIFYHFGDEIETILKSIYNKGNINGKWKEEDLYAAALEFRLLRQHGFKVPQEVFNRFKDETGNFKASLCQNFKGMLCLYDASYLSIEGENILQEAKDFTTKHLTESLDQNMDQYLAIQVRHALELPLHWRVQRIETRWFIDIYERRHDMSPILLELAKLDFNMVQAIQQEDLKHASRWWTYTSLGEKLSFARDRLVESFFWAAGEAWEPQHTYCRRMQTRVNILITVLDDIYDVYGTLEELEQFTDAIERWDLKAVDNLPNYMKICFLALYNFTNEMAYDFLKEEGSYIIPYLKQAWTELCKAYFTEAKWFYSGYKPTLEEYLNNAAFSISGPVILIHNYFNTIKPISKEALEWFEKCSGLIRWSSMIVRLSDDLGTSPDEMKKGDVPKSIQCYMNETGASEEVARKYIWNLIDDEWKKMNEYLFVDSPFPKTFVDVAMNLGRTSQCTYEFGDGFGTQGRESKERILSLFMEPISL